MCENVLFYCSMLTVPLITQFVGLCNNTAFTLNIRKSDVLMMHVQTFEHVHFTILLSILGSKHCWMSGKQYRFLIGRCFPQIFMVHAVNSDSWFTNTSDFLS